MARVVFLGTPGAAVPTLETLTDEHEIALVVTQPDRPKGRSATPVPPPVKESALEHGIEVAQPETREQLATVVGEHAPFDVGVVVAYGRILRPEVLEVPGHGMLNVHFSLLPRWRGAAPVARALMAGDEMTGVTIIRLDEGLDTGPVLTAQAIDISESDNAGELTDRLARLGARLVANAMPRYLAGEIEPVPQIDVGATYAEKIDKGDRPIDPASNAASVVAKVRALAPDPAATLVIDGETHQIHRADLSDAEVKPGTWRAVDGVPVVGFSGGSVELVALQPAGRNPRSGRDWLHGRHADHGIVG